MDLRLCVGGSDLPIEWHVWPAGDGNCGCETIWAEIHFPSMTSAGHGADGNGGQASDEQAAVRLGEVGGDDL